ncbi:MAG: RDD family protein [Phycisphaerales bacterium]|nr:RDD family protein [Phycisphaerales bacterium]
MLAIVACCVLSLGAMTARAEPPMTTRGAGAPAADSAPSHAWLSLPSKNEWIIAHVPPRRQAMPPDGKVRGAADGTLRRAASLSIEPSAMAAFGEDVYVAADDFDEHGQALRRVWTLRAVNTGVGDLWSYEPGDGLRSLRSLPSDGRMVGLAASGAGLVAVLAADSPASRVRVLWLNRGEWQELATPRDLDRWGVRLRCVSTREGFTLIAPDDSGSGRIWSATLRDGKEQAPAITWGEGVLARDRSLPTGAAPVEFATVGGRLISIAPAGRGARVLSGVDATGSSVLATLEGLEPDAAIAPLDSQGRLVVAWTRGEGSPRRPGEPPMSGRVVEMIELSANTGRVLYDAPSRADGPVTPGDLGLLGLLLIVAMGVALVLVVRGGEETEISLPPGMALAEPGRRMVASLIDGLIALVVASRLRGTPLLELASPSTFVTGELVWVLAIGIVAGATLGAMFEFLTGRSIGKAMVGGRVIRTTPNGEPARASLWQVLLRNAMKWALPPLSMLALVEPSRRSRVDLLTRTAVVVEFDPDADEPEPADDA